MVNKEFFIPNKNLVLKNLISKKEFMVQEVITV